MKAHVKIEGSKVVIVVEFYNGMAGDYTEKFSLLPKIDSFRKMLVREGYPADLIESELRRMAEELK